MREVELAAELIRWLRRNGHEDIYHEVAALDAVADLVVLLSQPKRLWVIEVKTTFGTRVMDQAYKWLRYAHYVSIAVPYRRLSVSGQIFCKDHGIGLIQCNEYSTKHCIEPRLNRKANIERICLMEQQKTFSHAGNAAGKRWTPYQNTCELVKQFVSSHPGCSLKELVDSVDHHYSSAATARSSLRHWIDTGKIPGVHSRREGRFIKLFAATQPPPCG